jgi:hypothetical protein
MAGNQSSPKTWQRPSYVDAMWMRCSQGLALQGPVPAHLRSAPDLASLSPWERVVAVFLHGQAGQFGGAMALWDIIDQAPDAHLRDCAIRVFSLTAPSSALLELQRAFEHPVLDTRTEAYAAAALTGDLRLAGALAQRRARVTARNEREAIMDNLSNMLEPWTEDLELVDSDLDGPSFIRRASELIDELVTRQGPETFIYRAEPLSAARAVTWITDLTAEEDPEELDVNGGTIATLFDLVEAQTGISRVGCVDQECSPVLPRISSVLNKLTQSGILTKLAPGRRYFFGHPVP